MLDERGLINFLQKYSKQYQNVIEVKELARGGEAIVYKMEHSNLDEVVAKCTLISE